MDTRLELEKAFKDYIYNDTDHSYKHQPTNKQLKSVTQFLKSISSAFNTEFWSVLKAFEYSDYTIKYKNEKQNYFTLSNGDTIIPGITDYKMYNLSYSIEDINILWKAKNILGTGRGDYVHNYLEQLDKRDYTTRHYSKDCNNEVCNLIQYGHLNHRLIKNYNDLNTTIEESFNIVRRLAKQFKEECNFLIPIACEYIIGDIKLGLCGTFDRLYYNESSGEYEIWDFKTDKEIKFSNKYDKFKLFDLDACGFEKYSLQTSLYKLIIQENTPIQLGESYIVHFDWQTNKYEIIKANDYTNLIKQEFNGNNDWTTLI